MTAAFAALDRVPARSRATVDATQRTPPGHRPPASRPGSGWHGLATGVRVSQPADPAEREADRVADAVMQGSTAAQAGLGSAPASPPKLLQRQCAACAASPTPCAACEEGGVPRVADAGRALDADTRARFEPHFGRDLGDVRIHANDAASSAAADGVQARAFTVGSDIVFAAGAYRPRDPDGQHLLAHELAHVAQRSGNASPRQDGTVVQRQAAGPGGGSGAAAACGIPSGCPADFCTPFALPLQAEAERTALAPVLLAGIAAKVSPRVVPLWSQYLFGGAAPQDLSASFGADFTASATTAATTDMLVEALRQDVEARPPAFAPGSDVAVVDIPTRIGSSIAAIGDPTGPDAMDFNVIGEIPGNIAGGIGKTQLSCPVGARPSPFDDARAAIGAAEVTRNPDGTLTVVPNLIFLVTDTIDLCPGNCGAPLEQVATVPMSRMEASGISGDVPFTVTFPAPARSVTARPAAPPPVPVPPAAAAVRGEVTASALRIRAAPGTSAAILGSYPGGTPVTIECQVAGGVVEGEPMWGRTDRGFVSLRYVRLLDPGPPPAC